MKIGSPVSTVLRDDIMLVEPAYGGETADGLRLPDEVLADENKRVGRVVAMGPGRIATKDEIENYEGCMVGEQPDAEAPPLPRIGGCVRFPMQSKIGDIVYFMRAAECRPQGPGTKLFYLVRDRDVCMTIDNLPERQRPKGPQPSLAIANAAGDVMGFVKP